MTVLTLSFPLFENYKHDATTIVVTFREICWIWQMLVQLQKVQLIMNKINTKVMVLDVLNQSKE